MYWSFLDKVYCISLMERFDRRQEAMSQFRKLGLAHKAEFVIFPKFTNNTEENIYRSHISTIQKGIDSGAQHILIFEDDIVFERFSPKMLDDINNFLCGDSRWNIFFLGCLVKGIILTEYPSVVKINYRCDAHAYILHREYAKHLVSLPWQGIAFDDLLRNKQKGDFFAVYPGFAFQSNSRTNNETLMGLDCTRRFFGGIKFIQKTNEFYHAHKQSLIILHILIAALIIVLIFCLC